jgi:predicted YcjX-like family ATPase
LASDRFTVDSLWRNLAGAGDLVSDLTAPTIRLGVTGLARSGKTVFITSLIHNVIHGGRLSFFDAMAEGRIRRAYLEPQPNDAVPRFAYDRHLAELTGDPPCWPESTERIRQLRLTIEFESQRTLRRLLGQDRLHVDIIDYPGEWLLDLPLLNKSYEEWSREAFEMSGQPERRSLAADWRAYVMGLDPLAKQSEGVAEKLADLFRAYLKSCRKEGHALSMLPPGRFLMPAELAGSPALTFSPLQLPASGRPPRDSLWQMMARRYESYKTHVVKPFFREHFARLDRQIVLVDVLSALNAGPAALRDLEETLTAIQLCLRPGTNSILSALIGRRIDHILFAATKADHLHQTSHKRLKNILARLTERASARADTAGAKIESLAIAAIRSTTETQIEEDGEILPLIKGVPLAGERLGEMVFDGRQTIAIFPGDLPANPDEALALGRARPLPGDEDIRFIRFRPPRLELGPDGLPLALPHIHLDQVLQFLLGDYLE